MQSTPLTAFHTQTHRPKCGDIMSSPPQLSPCCSATMDWWTSSRPSSPPPPPPLLHQAVLLLRCSAIAIYSCPPFSPCNTFTPQRYPLTLSCALFTLNKDKNKKYIDLKIGLVLDLSGSDVVIQKRPHTPLGQVSTEYFLLAIWCLVLILFFFHCLLVLIPVFFLPFKVQKCINWNLETALQRLLVHKRNTDNVLLGNI